MTILLTTALLFILWLIVERIGHMRNLQSIPLRIAVTGTRGKSSVVRLLASVLREDGRAVLAKTTGSRAELILPDGTGEEVRRRGVPSIIEQRQAVKRGARLGVDVVVMETMSIHPENHRVEGEMLVRPHLAAVTNTWPDHVEAMGSTGDEVAEVLAGGIPAGTTVILPVGRKNGIFGRGGESIEVESGISAGILTDGEAPRPGVFDANLDLVCGICRHLGVGEGAIREGIRQAERDVGELAFWRYRPEDSDRECFLVNGFAANDPVATGAVLHEVVDLLPEEMGELTGLLNLRLDRGDRTIQWIEALQGGWRDRFRKLYVTGGHARALARRLPGVCLLKGSDPEKLTRRIVSDADEGAVIFGFGNYHGMGEHLVEHWSEIGEPVGV